VKEVANVSGDNKNENLLESRPDLSAMEAALAELRPRREARFADELKSRMKPALAGDSAASPPESQTTTVRIPLTQYIRIAQLNAAAGGLLAGLFLGAIFGGAGVFLAMSRFATQPQQPAQPSYAAASPFARRLLEADASLTPLERSLLKELYPETNDNNR
jgi:hypothetical protein